MRVSRLIPFLLGAGLISAACGSDEEPESSGSKGGAGSGGTTAGSSGTGGASGSSTGGSSGSGGTGGGSGTGGGAGTGGTGGEINDGSAGTPADGSAGAPNAEVHCGTNMAPTTCTGGQVCCYILPGADYCSAPNACECLDGGQCVQRLPIPCDGSEDCPGGQICCGTLNTESGFPSYARVTCQATCSTANSEFEFCHGGDGGTVCKEAGTTCRNSTVLQGFQTCQPSG